MSRKDRSLDQLSDFKKSQSKSDNITTSAGAPVGNKSSTLTVGRRGPQLLEDHVFLDDMAHFDRERIPERVVHAKGAGAFGYFEVTHDITKYTKARIFEHIGKKTPLAIRFSTVAGDRGSADTARDPRGFAVKFYTEDGNWDLAGNNTPIFFIREPMLFPSFVHSQKRNPVTNLKDPDMFWDFLTLRPETVHHTSFVYSDRGTPDGYRFMNGYASHTFKLVNKDGKAVYCKFHHKCDQGIKNLPAEDSYRLQGIDPDYATRDLYNAIDAGNYPSWTTQIQVMTFEQAEQSKFNPFDLTKIWPHADYPLITVGKIVLNRNPKNYHAEVEQLAFAPAHMVPGVEPSPDRMLQGRLYAYQDTHRHRLGSNYLQIPVNCPYNAKVKNYQRDGPQMVTDNQGGAPNYHPNSFSGPLDDPQHLESIYHLSADVKRYVIEDDDEYSQTGEFWRKVLTEDERSRLVINLAGHLKDAQEFIQRRAVSNFEKADADYGRRVKEALQKHKPWSSQGQQAANL